MTSWRSLPHELRCKILGHYFDNAIAWAKAPTTTMPGVPTHASGLLVDVAPTSPTTSVLRPVHALEALWRFVDAFPEMTELTSEVLRLAGQRARACRATGRAHVSEINTIKHELRQMNDERWRVVSVAQDMAAKFMHMTTLQNETQDLKDELHFLLFLRLEGCQAIGIEGGRNDRETRKRREMAVQCLKCMRPR